MNTNNTFDGRRPSMEDDTEKVKGCAQKRQTEIYVEIK